MKKVLKISILALIIVFAYAAFVEPNLIVTKNINFKSDKIDNIKIVFFSDTHFGNNMYPENKLEDIVNKINSQNPDIVIFGGDLMDSYYKSPPNIEYIQSKFKEIDAKYGKYSVYGNHDYGGGAERVYKNLMKESDFIILKNDSTIIDTIGVRLIGLDDYLLGSPDIGLLNNIEDDYYNILISHAPDLIDLLNVNKINFILSGHTHGGQVSVPILTKKILPPGGRNYIKGKFDLDNDIKTRFYVTSGMGTTQIKLRFLNIPEIVTFDISK